MSCVLNTVSEKWIKSAKKFVCTDVFFIDFDFSLEINVRLLKIATCLSKFISILREWGRAHTLHLSDVLVIINKPRITQLSDQLQGNLESDQHDYLLGSYISDIRFSVYTSIFTWDFS